MTTDYRPPTTGQVEDGGWRIEDRLFEAATLLSSILNPRSSSEDRRSSVVGRRSSVVALIAGLVLLALTACGATPGGDPNTRAEQSGGGISPEAVTLSFFEKLGDAVKDADLEDEERRSVLVEQLVGYFAPNERDDQRVVLSDALAGLANGRRSLPPDETMTLELRFDKNRAEKIFDDGERATVRLINPTVYIRITRTADGNPVVVREKEVELAKLIGNADGAIPTIKIGRDWFLTEGQIGG